MRSKLFIVACLAAYITTAGMAQQVITVPLDAWNSGDCDRIPSSEYEARGGCDTFTPFTWTRDYQRFDLLSGNPITTSVSFLDPGNPDWN